MASKNFTAALSGHSWAHLPTWILMIGAAVFWLELYVIRLPYGHTSWLAWGLAGLCALLLAWSKQERAARLVKNSLRAWRAQSLFRKAVIASSGLLALGYGAIGLYASLFPPHLIQEQDVSTSAVVEQPFLMPGMASRLLRCRTTDTAQHHGR